MRYISEALHKLRRYRLGKHACAVLRLGLPAVAAYAMLLCFVVTADDPVRCLFVRRLCLEGFHAAWSALVVVVFGALCADCLDHEAD